MSALASARATAYEALATLERLGSCSDAALAEALAETAALSRAVDAVRLRLAGEVDRRSGPVPECFARRAGHRSAKECVADAFGIRARDAGALLGLAAATTPSVAVSGAAVPARFPLVGDTLAAGGLSLAQAQAIVDGLAEAAPRAEVEALAWAEGALVDAARDAETPLVPELLSAQARLYAAVLDPDGVLPAAERQRAMRSARMHRRRDGMWQLTILSPPEEGAAIKAVLDAHVGPRVQVRFRDDDGSSPELPDADDRTPAQVRHDVAAGILRAAAGGAPRPGGEAPTLVVTGSIEALTASLEGRANRERFATIEHTRDPMPIEHVERFLCDAHVQVAVTDPRSGHVLDLGRRQRLFTAAQRRALAVRDGGCAHPACSMPAAWCEAHHILPWQRGGGTDLGNAILLCSHHHHEVHLGRLRIERASAAPGHWRLVPQLRLRGRARDGAGVATASPERVRASSAAVASATARPVRASLPPSSPPPMCRTGDAAGPSLPAVAARPRIPQGGAAASAVEQHLRAALRRPCGSPRGGQRAASARAPARASPGR